MYAPLLSEALFAPSPDAYRRARRNGGRRAAAADGLADLFDRHPGEICAVILEPRVQCAGGMRMHDPVYLDRVRELCDAMGIPDRRRDRSRLRPHRADVRQPGQAALCRTCCACPRA